MSAKYSQASSPYQTTVHFVLPSHFPPYKRKSGTEPIFMNLKHVQVTWLEYMIQFSFATDSRTWLQD